MNLVIISFPEYLQTRQNTGLSAFAAWKKAGLVEQIAQHVNRTVWVNLETQITTESPIDRIVNAVVKLAETVQTIHAAGAFPLVFGGDRLLIALGIIIGLRNAGTESSIVWFDGHNPLTSSENALPPPLALLSGLQTNPLAARAGFLKPIPENHFLVAGVRQYKQHDDLDIAFWSADDLENTGVDPFDRKLSGSTPFYLHVDLGVLDPSIMPAVINPISEGLSLETLISSIDAATASARPVALGITNFIPERDQNNIGLATSLEAITSAIRILAIE